MVKRRKVSRVPQDEKVIFLIVGIGSVTIDFTVYLLLSAVLSIPTAKTFGFAVGASFSYFANRKYTFNSLARHSSTLWKFVFLYTLSLALNITINSFFLELLPSVFLGFAGAFIFATGASIVFNFIGMKFFVFKV